MKKNEEIIDVKKELQENPGELQQVRNNNSNNSLHYKRFLSSEIRSMEVHEI